MSSKLIIAAAGSGKTTFLVNESLKIQNETVLITTFTEANEREIKRKFIEINGFIPSNVVVQTWFSFLLQHGVKPYQNYVYEGAVKGLVLVNQRSGLKYRYKGTPVYYNAEAETKEHFFNKSMQIYSDKLAKFVVSANEKSSGLVIERLSKVFDYIFIDEVQDLAGYDLSIIKYLVESSINLIMVGDPRQVTYHTHEEAKWSKYSEGKIKEFLVDNLRPNAVEIDESSLSVTHRNFKDICILANRLYPQMTPCAYEEQEGTCDKGVFIVKEKYIDAFLQEFEATQIRHSIRTKINPQNEVINMGNSKGLTRERVLIYPTKDMENWIFDNSQILKYETRSKFYVAITRAQKTVGIVTKRKRFSLPEGIKAYVPKFD